MGHLYFCVPCLLLSTLCDVDWPQAGEKASVHHCACQGGIATQLPLWTPKLRMSPEHRAYTTGTLGKGRTDRQEVMEGTDQRQLNSKSKSMSKHTLCRSAPGDPLGAPSRTWQSPKSEAVSESSGFLPEYDLISLKERGQTLKSSNPSTVEQSSLFWHFKGWTVLKVASKGFSQFCLF